MDKDLIVGKQYLPKKAKKSEAKASLVAKLGDTVIYKGWTLVVIEEIGDGRGYARNERNIVCTDLDQFVVVSK